MTAQDLLDKISEEYSKILGDRLCGVYVHGSVAFGCYSPATSDIDFIVVVDSPLSADEKIGMISVLTALEQYAAPKGFEMSVVLDEHCRSFVYPTPFELHYSENYRQDAAEDIGAFCGRMHGKDHDLAAHFTVIREVGYPVCGKPVSEVFGEVPAELYLDSIVRDISDVAEYIGYNPVYYTLNLCRVLAYKKGAGVLSKAQGAEWAIEHIPPVYATVVGEALSCYHTGEAYPEDMPLAAFAEYMLSEIDS